MIRVKMKIAITADLHWGSRSEGDESTRKMVALLQAEAPDVIVLAGDIGSRGLDRIHECLDLFSAIDATRLFIAGNHDVWTRDGNSVSALLWSWFLTASSRGLAIMSSM